MFTYIRKSVIGNYIESELDLSMVDGYRDSIGTTFEDYLHHDMFVPLSQEQLEFRGNNPMASVKEVWEMKLVEPEPEPQEPVETEEQHLERVRMEKLSELEAYDSSESVNGFGFGGQTMWLAPADRTNYLLTLQGAQRAGIETVEFLGVTIDVASAISMLDAINIYAMVCVATTNAHREAISELATAEEIEAYDFTVGYPAQLSF